MTRALATTLFNQINGRKTYLAEKFVQPYSGIGGSTTSAFMSALKELAEADYDKQIAETKNRNAMLCDTYGYSAPQDEKPFAFSSGVAIIPIHGMLINRFSYSWSFVTGYNFIRSQVNEALLDEDVQKIIFDINTNGGTVAGCQETADIIFAASGRNAGGKQSLAVIDDMCFSAGYFLAASADRIVCTPSGETGSIGTMIHHTDVSAMMEKQGIKDTFITSPKGGKKAQFNSYEPLSDEAQNDLQHFTDEAYKDFVAAVVRGRGLSAEEVVSTQAACFIAMDALSIGLIDAIQTPSEAVADFFNQADPDSVTDDDDFVTTTGEQQMAMTEQEMQAAIEKAGIDAAAAERNRMNAILNSPEATGREDLAKHLANQPGMSAEVADGILKVAAKQAAGGKGDTGTLPSNVANNPNNNNNDPVTFQQYMNNDKQPNVGPNSGKAAGEKPDRGAGLIAAAKMAGHKLIEGKAR